MKPIFVVIAVAVFIGVLAIAAPASAHAYIVASAPAPGAVVGSTPTAVRIQFDEPVELPNGPAIEVLDGSGRRVDDHDAAIDPNDVTSVVAHLAHLARGSYQVRWRVVSADTHVVHGIFSFGIGVAPAAGTSSVESTVFDPSSSLASILRWLSLSGIVAAVGALLFAALFLPAREAAFGSAATWQLRFGAGLALLSNVGLFVVQSAASAGTPAGGLSLDALGGTLHSSFGFFWLLRIVAVGVLLACSTPLSRSAQSIGLCAAALALGTLSLAGHATANPAFGSPAEMEVVDWVHLASVSLWLGGLGVLTVGLVRSGRELTERERCAWLARFTGGALPGAVLTFVTGAYAMLAHEPHLTLLLSTQWGLVLALKLVFFVVLLALGSQSLCAGQGLRPFSARMLFGELIFAVAILAATGVLVGQSPPACMFMPPGSRMPAGSKMPPGMQMCSLRRNLSKGSSIHVG